MDAEANTHTSQGNQKTYQKSLESTLEKQHQRGYTRSHLFTRCLPCCLTLNFPRWQELNAATTEEIYAERTISRPRASLILSGAAWIHANTQSQTCYFTRTHGGTPGSHWHQHSSRDHLWRSYFVVKTGDNTLVPLNFAHCVSCVGACWFLKEHNSRPEASLLHVSSVFPWRECR